MRRLRLATLVSFTLLLSAGVLSGVAQGARDAAVFTPTRFDDPAPNGCNPGDCSFREAVIAANAAGGQDEIRLSAGTYTLSIPGTAEDAAANGDLDITDSLIIRGAGRDATTFNAGGATTSEAHLHLVAPLDISGVTLTGGANVSGNNYSSVSGIGIESGGSLTMSNAAITGNSTAPTGCCAGITTNAGTGAIDLRDVLITGNSAGSDCCAGIVATATSITLSNVVISGNRAQDNCCAGLVASTPALSMTNVEITDNYVGDDCCAGVIVSGFSSPATLTNVTVGRNTAAGADGSCCAGVVLNGPTTLTNVTIVDNSTVACCAGFHNDDVSTLNNVTVARNMANSDNNDVGNDDDGAGLSNDGGTLTVRNTISYGNRVGTGGLGPDCFGTVTSAGYNLIGTLADCSFTGDPTGNLIGVDPKLGPLTNNGGFTSTVALQPGSPAINAGNPAAPGSGGNACAATDQRGLPRSDCDMGAYELVLCGRAPVNRIGGTGNDVLTGTAGVDGFLTGDGNDRATGLGGADAACLGGGNDTWKGGGGKDRGSGEAGRDNLNGGGGTDVNLGGPGKDTLKGGAGRRDRCKGGPGNDQGGRGCEKGRL